jgi:hypothetical protein
VQQTESLTGVQVLSVYAKAGTANFIVSEKAGTNGYYVWFDLGNGTIGNTSGEIDATIDDVGGGWYRCSISGNPSASSKSQFYVAETNGSTTVSVGASIYIQSAQLESGLVSTDYLESTSVTGKAGVLVDLPRINFDANGENGSLLLEPSRQNKIQFSEYFGASDWALDGGTQSVTNNYSISPEGVKNAARLQLDKTGTTYSRLYVDAGSVGEATISVYMKSNTSQTQNVGLRYDGTGVNCEVPTEWKRFDLTATSTSVSRFQILLFDSIAGNDETADISIYGAMLEQNVTYPSSYIPNHGESGGVTRAADSLYADNIGQTTAYTIFLDYEDLEQADSNFQDYISFQASGSNQNGLRAEGVGSDWRLYGYGISGSVTFPIAGSVSKKKKAIVVSTAGIKLFEDGALTNQDLSGMTIPALGAITTKRGTSAPYPVEIKNSFKQIAVFNEALSDAECISLTS